MFVRFVLALALIIAAPFAHAQTNRAGTNTRYLTLQECIDLALSKNLDVQIQRVSTDIANYTFTSAFGAYDPSLSIFGRRDFLSQPLELDVKKTGLDAPYKLTTDSVGGGLNGKLPIGLSYQIGARAAEAKAITDFRFNTNLFPEFGFTNNPTTNFPGGFRRTNEFFANAGFTVQQHLLRDAWIDQERTLIHVRRKELKMSEQAMMFQIMRTVLAVEVAYYDLVAARELVRVEEKALELKDQFVAETRRRVEVGDLPPLDSEQAETQLETTRTALIAAREAWVSRQNALKFLITDDFRELVDIDLQPAHDLTATERRLIRSESFKSALSQRPDLAEARLAIERSDVEVRFYKNQLFPNLDLFGHYGGVGIHSDGSSAVSDALHFRDQEYYYGVVLTVPLARIRERSDYAASKARRELAELQLKKAEQQVFLQIADLVNRVQSRFSQVGSTRKARVYAEAALAAEQKKLQNGLTTSFIVLQLQEILTGARTAEIQALADYNEMLAQLAFAEGATMQQHRLEFRWR